MSENNDKINIFDPTGMMKSLHNANMEQWAKMMTEMVNSDAYAEANAEMINAWLNGAALFRQAMEKAVNNSLAAMNLASRDDFIGLAERLTNIEMRLDDIEAKLDEGFQRLQNRGD